MLARFLRVFERRTTMDEPRGPRVTRMVRALLTLPGASGRRLLRVCPRLATRFPYTGPLGGAPVDWSAVPTLAPAPLASARPHAGEVVAAYAALVRKVARLARSDLLPPAVRFDLPVVRDLRAAGARRTLAHEAAAGVVLSLLRVAAPEVALLSWTGEPPGPVGRVVSRLAPGARGTVPGWRSEVPLPAWTEGDLLRALRERPAT